MKIVHIAPNAPYNEYWGYQENLLPKYHRKLGHNVTVIITNLTHKDGQIVETHCTDYILNDGVRIIRLAKKKYLNRSLTDLKSRIFVFNHLADIRPDFIFYHGLLSDTIFDVIKYKKKINPNCIVVQDNHLDYNIGTTCPRFIDKVYRFYHRCVNKYSISYVDRVYGVTPWRKTYAEDYFHIPSRKTDLLIMGADDEKIDFANREKIRAEIREKYGISDTDFMISTGGKIDKKKNIHYLMEACKGLDGVKLLVFGKVYDDIKQEFEALLQENSNIIYVGWVESDKVYIYFIASDLAIFPGQHSVLWEQACASKVPCIFERWEGMEHVNNGGNSDFVLPVTTQALKEKILELQYTDKYFEMKKIAQSNATDVYLYSNIAKKSLECAK